MDDQLLVSVAILVKLIMEAFPGTQETCLKKPATAGVSLFFQGLFMKLCFKELDFKELGVLGYLLGVLGYSDLLRMQWRSRLFRSIGIGRSRLFRSIGIGRSRCMGVPMDWLLDLS